MQSAVTSPRVSIPHLKDLKDDIFVRLLLSNEFDSRFSLKIDGCSGRFGVDSIGIPFFETGRSGPIYDSGKFKSYAVGRGFSPERIERASMYDEIFSIITESMLVKVLPNNTKVFCEMLYRPMGVDRGDSIQFVTIPYQVYLLGDPLTIFPYQVTCADTTTQHEESIDILSILGQVSNNSVKVISPILADSEFDFDPYTKLVLEVIPDDWDELLISRKAIHRDRKLKLKTDILKIKYMLSENLLKPLLGNSSVVGYTNEGLVCIVNDIRFKVVTNEYRNMRGA